MHSHPMPPLQVLSLSLATLLMALSPNAHATIFDDAPAGTGYTSHDLCTRVMVSGDDFRRVKNVYVAPIVQPLPDIWTINFQAGQRVTTATVLPLFEYPRKAIYRPGLGCTVVPPDSSESKVRSQPFTPASPVPVLPLPWPQGEDGVETALLTPAQASLIQRHGDLLFAETTTDPGKKQNTFAFLVAHNGHLVHERYATGYNRSQPQLGWSMTKSLTALIAGMMATEGRLSLDAPVALPQWRSGMKSTITWKQLLNNAPGLQWNEGYEGASDTTEMLYSRPDQANWAANRPMESRPGTVFNYSTGFVNIAMLRMKQLLGNTHQGIYDYYQQNLFAPLGIQNGIIEPDVAGTPVGGARGVLRPVDWLRLGQLVAQKGVWKGKTLIAPAVMDFLLAASPASPQYGGYIWRVDAADIPPDVRSRLPDDLVWFSGHLGQDVVIVPSKQLVVLRMGVAMDENETTKRLMTAVADLLPTL